MNGGDNRCCRQESKRALAGLEKLRRHTGYEITSFCLITDANGAEWETRYKTERGVIQICSCENNRAKRLCAAVKQAQGDYLVFLDTEMERADVDWVEQLVMFAQQDGIGAVGSKILRGSDAQAGGVYPGAEKQPIGWSIPFTRESIKRMNCRGWFRNGNE